jgi:hypothetical protein
LVASAEHDRFAAAVRSTRRLRDSRIAELTVLVLAYVVVVLILSSAPAAIVPGWNRTGADATALSPAGRWHAFVSMPILLTLFLGWMWRLALWARFLRLMARLDLQLVASHPDGAGGLRFVGYSSRAAAPLAFALGAVVAGRLANLVLHTGASPFDSRYTVAGLVVFLVVLFNGPLVAFIGPMLTAWQQGAARYGALAAVEGRAFERKWLTEARRGDEEMLAATDFSATTDLYAVVANVYAMRPLPLDLQSIAALVTATLLPFVPVVLMAVPFDVIIGRLTSLLL